MYESSEDAMADNRRVSLEAAKRELRHHRCRVIDWRGDVKSGSGLPSEVLATNDCDPPEWVPCTTKAILEYLGY